MRTFYVLTARWRKYIPVFFAAGILITLAIVIAMLFKAEGKNDFWRQYSFSISNGEYKLNLWDNEQTDTLYLFLPAFASLNRVQISCPNEYTIKIGNYEYRDNDYLHAYGLNQLYEVKVLTQDKKNIIQSSHLMFMKAENIASMFIHTKSGTTEYIDADKANKETADMTLVDKGGNVVYNNELLFIKGRGNLSWAEEKKPYNIKLSTAQDLLGMGESSEWCLIANHLDGSNIRNTIVYEFAENIGVPFAPDSEFVDLYLNGQYAGLYQLTENVQIGENRINIYDLERETQNVNARVIEKYGSIETSTFKAYKIGENPEDISEGYLLQLELSGFYKDTPSWIITHKNQPLTIKSPAYASVEQVIYVKRFLQQFEEALYANSGVNSAGKPYLYYIDLYSWAMKYLIDEVFSNQDAEWSSQYFYIADKNDVPVLFAGPPWDYDLSMGNHWHEEDVIGSNPRTFVALWREEYDPRYVSWYGQLYDKNDFQSALATLYRTKFKALLDEFLRIRIKETSNLIYTSALMNRIRWYESDIQSAAISLKTAYDYLLEYMSDRVGFLDSVWLGKERYYSVSFNGSLENIFYKFSVKYGQTIADTPVPQLEGYTFLGWYSQDTGMPFDKTQPIKADVHLNAKWAVSIFSLVKQYYLIIPILAVIAVFIFLFFKGWVRRLGG